MPKHSCDIIVRVRLDSPPISLHILLWWLGATNMLLSTNMTKSTYWHQLAIKRWGHWLIQPDWMEHSAVLLCHFDVDSMVISKLILATFSLASHLSYDRQNFGILLNNCLWIMVLISIYHCLVRMCACACVWGWACVSVFVCLFCMPCVEWVWMFFVLSFYVIYSQTIASVANVFCWLYPILNKVYLILYYVILSYLKSYDSS